MNFLSTELRSFGAVLREKDLSIVISLDQFNQLPIAIKKTERPKLFHLVLHLLHKKLLFFRVSLVFSQHQTCTQRVLEFKDSFGENLSGMGFVCVLI